MARPLGVVIVGDSRSLERAFYRSSKSASKFTRDIEKMGRGALSGSGLVRGLGRSLAFASGGFLAFAGVSKFLTDSVGAARDAAVSQRSLAAQMKASGESFTAYAPLVEKVSLAYGKFGFENDEVVKSLTILDRATGNIGEATRRQTLVAEIARVKNIDLAAAAAVVGKVYGGQETALRRAVPGLSKAAKGADLLNEAQKRLRGQLAANTTASERFHAQLHNTEEIIGGALLPVLNRYLGAFGDWLGRMNESGKLQRDVNALMKTLTGVFGQLWQIVKAVSGALNDLAQALGGWGTAMTLAIGAWAGFKAAALVSTAAVTTANLVAAGVVAEAWQAALISTGFGALAVAGGIAAAYVITHWEKVKLWFQEFWIWLAEGADKAALAVVEPFSHLPSKLGGWARDAKSAIQADLKALDEQAGGVVNQLDRVGESAKKLKGPKLPKFPDFKKFKFPATATVTESLADRLAKESAKAVERLQLGIDRAGLTTGLADDLAALEKLRAYLAKRIKVEKKNLGLQKQLIATEKQIADVTKQMADARAARRDARQFAILGFGPTGEDLVPGVKSLRKTVASVQERILGTFLDTKKTTSLLRRIRSVLGEGINAVGKEVRAKIASILADLNAKLKQNADKVDHTRFVKANVDAITGGLGLNRDQRRALRYRFSAVGAGGTVPSGSAQFAHAGTVNVYGGVHVHGVQDATKFERELMKRSKQCAHTRRGR